MEQKKTAKALTVLISGKFIVLHAGHMRLLKSGKDLGERLIVCLDISESTVEESTWRKSLISELSFVDEVLTYTGSISPVIRSVRPDIVLKGKEFSERFNEEEEVMKEIGGRLLFTSGSTHFTKSDLITISSSEAESFLALPGDYLVRNSIPVKELIDCVRDFTKLRIAVVGDLIVDEYIACHPLGMSQEDPTVVVTPIDKRKFIGGAAIVAAHSASLGSRTKLFSVGGDDDTMDWLHTELEQSGVELNIQRDSTRPTTLKQRFKSGQQILLKLTHLRQDAISNAQRLQLISDFTSEVKNFDVVIFSDFSYGVLQHDTVHELIDIARSNGLFIAADSQTSSQVGDLSKYKGVDLLTPTEKEARLETRDEVSGLVVLAEKLRSRISPKNILLKIGPDGVLVHGISESGQLLKTDKVEALNKNAVDTSGAGDSLLVGSVLSLALGKNIYISALIGSIMAGIQVNRVGNVPITLDEVLRQIKA
jgi:rfaE bifunctional protein kinase chain/domain